jgi:hypothetical protein
MTLKDALNAIDWEYLFAKGASTAMGLIICIIGVAIIYMWWCKYNERE